MGWIYVIIAAILELVGVIGLNKFSEKENRVPRLIVLRRVRRRFRFSLSVIQSFASEHRLRRLDWHRHRRSSHRQYAVLQRIKKSGPHHQPLDYHHRRCWIKGRFLNKTKKRFPREAFFLFTSSSQTTIQVSYRCNCRSRSQSFRPPKSARSVRASLSQSPSPQPWSGRRRWR